MDHVKRAKLTLLANATIAVIMLIAALDAGQTLLAPVLGAIVLGVVLGPLADRLERLHVPSTISALMVLLAFIVIVFFLYLLLEPRVHEVIINAPSIWNELRDLVDTLRGAVAGVQEIQETMNEALTSGVGSQPGTDADAVPVPNVMMALSYGPSLVGGIVLFLATFYFFLATRHDVYARLSRFVPFLSETLLRNAERRVSTYFIAITLINASFGVVIMIVMSLFGMPQALMWGIAAFLLNFLLYLGPAVLAASLLLVGFVVFDGFMAVVPAVCYVLLNMTEGQFVTPSVIGRHMAVNPLMIFLSLIFWLWLWGPIGGLVAIPVLVWMRFIITDGNEPGVPVPQPLDEEDPA